MEEETRTDPSDGRQYTKKQFLEEYRGEDEWEAASTGVPGGQRRSGWDEKPPANDGREAKRTKAAGNFRPQRDRGWRFAKFDRVRCNIGGEHGWQSGQIQAVDHLSEGSCLPYIVQLEPPLKRLVAVPYDDPSHVRPEVCFAEEPYGGECAQAVSLATKKAAAEPLRFTVGARVACLTAGPDGTWWPRRWSAGTVRDIWYKAEMSEGVVPYAVALDQAGAPISPIQIQIVLCHRDEHLCVRALELQPPGECANATVLQRFTERHIEETGYVERIDQQTFGVRKQMPKDSVIAPPSTSFVAASSGLVRPASLMWDVSRGIVQFPEPGMRNSCQQAS